MEAYRGKRVLVTGHTGFKGSWLCLRLLRAGASVCGYALAPRTPRDNFVLAGLATHLDHHEGDIRSAGDLTKVAQSFRPEIAFHLAAQPLVKVSYANPLDTFAVNVHGTATVLDVLRGIATCQAVVVMTSDKCYENQEWLWGYREEDRLGGHDPYSASKAAAEIVAAAYRRSFYIPSGRGLATARAGNVIGGGDWSPDRLIPDCIRSLERGDPVVLRHPNATRPWQHVLEPVGGYLRLGAALLLDSLSCSEAWNFGPDPACEYTVQQVVEMVVMNWGTGQWKLETSNSIHEAGLLSLDISKARRRLGWRPVWDAPRAVAETVRWYLECRGQEASDVCVRQIAAYENDESEAA